MQAHVKVDSVGAPWHSFPTEFRAARFDHRVCGVTLLCCVPLCLGANWCACPMIARSLEVANKTVPLA